MGGDQDDLDAFDDIKMTIEPSLGSRIVVGVAKFVLFVLIAVVALLLAAASVLREIQIWR